MPNMYPLLLFSIKIKMLSELSYRIPSANMIVPVKAMSAAA